MDSLSPDAVAITLAQRLIAGTEYVVVPKSQVKTEEESPPWDLKQFAFWARRSPDWVKKKILYRYRNKLDRTHGGWVTYSNGSGSPWRIPVEKTKRFVIEHELLSR